MEWTPTVQSVLTLARLVKFLNRQIVQEEYFVNDADGSVSRDWIRRAVKAVWLRRIDVTDEYRKQNAPLYTCTEQGCCELATRTGDMSLLLDRPANTRSPQDFPHHLAVTRLLIQFMKAFSAQNYAECVKLVTEHDFIDPDAKEKKPLYTETDENKRGGKVVCHPDFAFLLKVGPYRRAYYFEFETGGDGSPTRVQHRKAPGYAGLHETGKYRLHFLDAQDMRVVAVCPNAGWREAMRKAVHGLKGEEMWLYVARGDITPSSLLHAEIFYAAEGGPRPLVKAPPGAAPPSAPAQERIPGPGGEVPR